MANNNDFPIKTWRNVVIQQQTDRGFDGDFITDLVDDWDCVKKYAYIVHDKDKNADNEDVTPHIHCAISFHKPVQTSVLLNRCNKIKDGVIAFEQLNNCHSWKGTILYFTHKKCPEKAQYEVEDIISNYNHSIDIEKALEVPPADVLEEIKLKIKSGECRPYNIHHFCNEDIYSKYSKVIDGYFRYNQLVLNEKMKGDRNMRLIYIQGGSECGKTTYAKRFCEAQNWSYYVSSGGASPLDNYQCEDCIILDDFRPSDYKFNEFLKLTDNHTSSMVHCRYYNKSLAYCRCIIVTSSIPIDDIYNNVTMLDNKEKEEARQLKRRFGEVYEFTKDTITSKIYDTISGTHMTVGTSINPIGSMYKRQREEELRKKAHSFLSALTEFIAPDVGVQTSFDDLSKDGFTPTNEPTPFDDDLPY